MPEYLAPGVYVEETSFRARSIEGVPTHSTALLGMAAAGPQGTPTRVTSYQEFTELFGEPAPGAAISAGAPHGGNPQHLRDAVRGFFENGGRRLYIVAIANADAIPAALTSLDTLSGSGGGGGGGGGGGAGVCAGGGADTGTGTGTDADAGATTNERFDYVSLVAAPGFTDHATQQALIDHGDQVLYRFAILDAAANADIQQVRNQRERLDSKRAALYYPWLEVADGGGTTRTAPPSGHIAGIYARVDAARGVHKSPANETLRGVVRLERVVTQAEHELLNPEGINVIRDFRDENRGIRVWGARTISSDPEWKYISVRRLLNFLEQSIDRGTQWAVFETNGEPLWGQVRRAVTNFLTELWRDGALLGPKAEHAFFVVCDRSTMSRSDIDNGRLICEIGVAPVKPAEFVIFRIGQIVGSAGK